MTLFNKGSTVSHFNVSFLVEGHLVEGQSHNQTVSIKHDNLKRAEADRIEVLLLNQRSASALGHTRLIN